MEPLRPAAFLLLLAFIPSPAFAEEPSSDYILQMARVDLMLRKQEYLQAADELGRVPKTYQNDSVFQEYADKVVAALYGSNAQAAARMGGPSSKPPDRIVEKLRVTRQSRDASFRSDQSFDHHDSLQINQHLEADVEGKDGIRAKFVSDLDGFKDGHNDVRYRTLLADFYDGPSHVAAGDSATYTSPYFLRGSRLRGVDLLFSGPVNEFQALGGAYPFWLKDRSEYIYPRSVAGIRDRWKIFDDRVRLGANFVRAWDDAKIRTIDTANQERDNSVYSLDQEFKLIPDIWFLKTAEAYSYTDEDLLESRFGDSKGLKDTSYQAETTLIQPWARWTSRFERTGPDFRLLVDLPSGGVLNQKTLTADRQIFENFFNFQPIGPLDLDVQTSWYRNNLNKSDTVETTRQGWYTANLGILVPRGWPRPRFRATVINTLSSPGPTSRARQNRVYNLHSELSHYHEGMNFTEFAEYEGEFPQKDEHLFSAEENWAFGTRMSTMLLDRILVSPHYTYKITDAQEDMFQDGPRLRSVRGTHHEAGISNSIMLWSTASLGLSYTFLRGKLADPTTLLLTPSSGHSGTVSFTWPYTWHSWNQRRKLTLFPGITGYINAFDHGTERRPLLSSELTLSYEVLQNWKAELRGEYLHDKDYSGQNIRTEESRFWMLWTKQWEGQPQWVERPREKRQTKPSPFQMMLEEARRRLQLETDFSLRSGYRTDDLNWNIAGDINGRNPNILSELTWKDLKSYQVGGTARLTARPFLSGRFSADYGWILNGRNQDSDYDGDNRTLEFSRSNNASNDGSLLDLSGGIGYPWEPPSGGHEFRLTPLVGYSYHEQNLTLTNGFQTIPATGPFAGLDSEYQSRWKGPWLGTDAEFKPWPKIRFFGAFEYHWASYKADARWNLRTDLAQPKSFRHTADGNGVVGSAGIGYLLSKHLSLELNANYQEWSADKGTARDFLSDGTTADTRLNEVRWKSLGVSLGVRGRY